MFLGRKTELAQLNRRYAADTFACTVLYGRRRVGKTALIREFAKGKPAILFSAVSGTALDNLRALSQAIQLFQHSNAAIAPCYSSYPDAFSEITRLAQSQHLILAIDNLSCLIRAEPSIVPLLQQYMDGPWNNAKLFLILSDCSLRFEAKSPLFEEHAEPLQLLPLPYWEAARFTPDRTPAENALLYGITGGIPFYSAKLQVQDGIREALLQHLFHPDSALFEEPEKLLQRELRDLSLYNSVLTAIAGGAQRLSAIADKTGTDTAACIKYINVLTGMGITERRQPLPQTGPRRTQYAVSDHFFRFWYRFVQANLQFILAGRMEQIYPDAVEQHLEDFMKPVFRDLCVQYLVHDAASLPFPIQKIGDWWGTLPKSRAEVRIDIVAAGPDHESPAAGKEYLSAACIWRDAPAEEKDLYLLRKHASLVSDRNDSCLFYLFSKAGFTGGLLEKQRLGEVRLISLEDMYQI